ncbi:MAG: hypothetical protein AAGB46_12995 [Verrucomicrobiota bacterium]
MKTSDSILGNDWMSFDDFNLRGLEGADETIIQNDAAFISWRASSPAGWARVATCGNATPVPEPEFYSLFGVIPLALAAYVRIKRNRIA